VIILLLNNEIFINWNDLFKWLVVGSKELRLLFLKQKSADLLCVGNKGFINMLKKDKSQQNSTTPRKALSGVLPFGKTPSFPPKRYFVWNFLIKKWYFNSVGWGGCYGENP
jgi:hypothetical protein